MSAFLTVHCPLCGTPLKILDTIPTICSEGGTANVSVCKCGVFDIVVRYNKVMAVRLRNPEMHPDFRPQYW